MGREYVSRDTLKDFIAGALMGSAPMWVVVYLLLTMGLRESTTVSAMIIFLSTLLGGAIAGYTVISKVGLEVQVVGPTTGMLSYIFASLILLFFGFRGEIIEEISSLTGYFVGSGIGAKIGFDTHYYYVEEE